MFKDRRVSAGLHVAQEQQGHEHQAGHHQARQPAAILPRLQGTRQCLRPGWSLHFHVGPLGTQNGTPKPGYPWDILTGRGAVEPSGVLECSIP
jgi:hypothetical protein